MQKLFFFVKKYKNVFAIEKIIVNLPKIITFSNRHKKW